MRVPATRCSATPRGDARGAGCARGRASSSRKPPLPGLLESRSGEDFAFALPLPRFMTRDVRRSGIAYTRGHGRPMAGCGMALLRIAIERLLLALFWIARSAFLACALATVAAALATAVVGAGSALPSWLGEIARSWGLVGGTSLLAAVLLFAAPHLGEPAEVGDADGPPAWVWPLLIGFSLVLLPSLTWARCTVLVALWREICVLLDRVGFWDAFQRADPFAGIAILPILAALLVPALETAAACFLIAAPLGLVALLPTRSRLFPRLFALIVVCQAGLVVACLLGA